jgi:hypothetical protein
MKVREKEDIEWKRSMQERNGLRKNFWLEMPEDISLG